MPKKLPETGQRRSAALTGTFNREARTVDAVLATSEWIEGAMGPERLIVSDAAVDLSHASPMPLHDNHGPQLPGTLGARIGVVENVRINNGRLKGRLRLSRNPEGEAALQDIEDKIITHVSVGFRVIDARPAKTDAHMRNEQGILITKWAPHEVSTPSVVADRAAIIQRANDMKPNVEREIADPPIEETEAYKAGQQAAQARIHAITAAFDPFPQAAELRIRAMREDWTAEKARAELLAYLGKGVQPTPRGGDVVGGEDVMDKFMRGASQALEVRAGIMITEDVPNPQRLPVKIMTEAEAAKASQGNEYLGYSLRELAREYLRVCGDRPQGDPKAIVGLALTRAGIISHTTSDFLNLLVDASNKALQLGYEESAETWEEWTGSMNLPDFKTGQMPKLSTFSDLDEVPESGEIHYGTFSDFKETIALIEYAKLFSITRKAIINDDLGAFTDAPRGMARAANRKIGDKVYEVFSTNGNMSDGNALFSSAHANYIAGGSGAAPSVTTLNAAYASMALQTDPGGATLNMVPAHILAGHTLRGTVDALLASALDPAEGSSTSFQATNVWRARLRPTYEARIDADDTAKWYLAAARNLIDTVKVAFLNGVRTPRLEREESITVNGVIMKVSHDVGVAAADWRGLYHNDGN